MVKADNPEKTPVKVTPAKTVEHPVAPAVTTNDGGLPLVSLILGIVSLATFMVFLGIPAIVLGIIGLKKYPESNRAFSITGIITGIVSTILMIAISIFLIFAIIIGIAEESSTTPAPREEDSWQQYYNEDEESEQPTYRGMREGI